MNVYGRAMTDSKRQAHSNVVQLVLQAPGKRGGSTFGSTSPTVLPTILGPGRRVWWLVPFVRRGAISVSAYTLATLPTSRAFEANILGISDPRAEADGEGNNLGGHGNGSGLKTRASCHRGQPVLLD
jgi:hypothetical protein